VPFGTYQIQDGDEKGTRDKSSEFLFYELLQNISILVSQIIRFGEFYVAVIEQMELTAIC
jgi:hypothetical protein